MSPSPSCHQNCIAQLPPAAGDSCPAQTSAHAVCAWGASPRPLSPAFPSSQNLCCNKQQLPETPRTLPREPANAPTRQSLHSTATAKTPAQALSISPLPRGPSHSTARTGVWRQESVPTLPTVSPVQHPLPAPQDELQTPRNPTWPGSHLLFPCFPTTQRPPQPTHTL